MMETLTIDHALVRYAAQRWEYARFLRSHGWVLTAGNHAVRAADYVAYDHEMNRRGA